MDAASLWLNFVMASAAVAGGVVAFTQAKLATQERKEAEAAEARAVAAAEGSAAALAEANRLTVERIPDQVQVAYQDLMRVTSELISHTFLDAAGPRLLRDLRLHMTFLTEQVGDRFPSLGTWLEAERQLGLKHALAAVAAVARIKQIDQTTEEDILTTSEPFNRWAAEFTTNLRAWRHGVVTELQVLDQAKRIRDALMLSGEWREPMSWRDTQ